MQALRTGRAYREAAPKSSRNMNVSNMVRQVSNRIAKSQNDEQLRYEKPELNDKDGGRGCGSEIQMCH